MDDTAGRAAFEAWWNDNAIENWHSSKTIARVVWLAASRSIPAAAEKIEAAYRRGWNDRESDILERADSMGLPDPVPFAAALLREAGWRVEQPKCETCKGTTWIGGPRFGPDALPCPTCDGTGERP